jgi:hypothetical protein
MMDQPNQRRILWRYMPFAVALLALLIAASTVLADQGGSLRPDKTLHPTVFDGSSSYVGAAGSGYAPAYDGPVKETEISVAVASSATAYVPISANNSDAPSGCTQPGLLIADTQPISYPYNTNSSRQIHNTIGYAHSQGHIGVANKFALFQAHDPYIERGYPPYIKNAILAHGYTYDQFAPGSLSGFNFNNYRVVLLLWDAHFTTEFNSPYQAAIPALQNYITAGGVVWVQGGFWGSSSFSLPFGGTANLSYVRGNDLTNIAHPITQGLYNPYTGNYASHGWFSGLPSGATTLMSESQTPTRYTAYEYRPSSACPTLTPVPTVTGTPPTSTPTSSPTNTPVPIPVAWCVDSQGRPIGSPCEGTAGTAFLTIQEAIDVARPGDEIRIAAGTYYGAGNAVAVINKSLTFIGGYPGGAAGWTTPGAYTATSVDGQNARRSFEVQGVFTATLSNLQLVNGGFKNDGGTVSVVSSTLRLNGGASNGHFAVASDALLEFWGHHTLENGASITGPGYAKMVLSGYTLTIAGAATVQNFNLAGGILGGPGTLTATEVLSWTGGSMAGTGVTYIPATARLNIMSGTQLNGRTVNNEGTATWMNAGQFYLYSGTFNNNGLFEVRNTFSPSGSGVFNNTGTFRKASDVGNIDIHDGVAFNNSGVINVPNSTLTVSTNNNKVFTMLAGAQVTGAGFLRVASSFAQVNIAGTTTAQNLNFAGGTITGTSTLTVTGVLSWTGGSMAGTGVTYIPPSAQANIASSTGSIQIDGRTVNNEGTATWMNAGQFYLYSGTFNNNGLFEVRNTFSPSGSGVFNNTGTFRKASDVANIDIHDGVAFNNSGVINVPNSMLTIAGSGGGGSVNMLAGAQVTGAGFLRVGAHFSALLNIAGPTTAQNLLLTGGTITGTNTLTVTGVLSWTGGTMAGTGVTYILPSAQLNMAYSTNYLVLDGRTLNNAGTATWMNAGPLYVRNGGTFNNNSLFDVQNTLYVTDNGGTFNNTGTLRKRAGYNFTSSNVLNFNNLSTGKIEIESGQMYLYKFSNAGGTVTLNGGTFAGTPLNLQGGTLKGVGTVSGGLINGGSIAPGTSPGIITDTTTYTQYPTGTLNIEIGGLTPVTQHDQLKVTGAATLSGTLNLSLVNGYTPNANDTFTFITYGSRTGTFSTVIGGCVNWAITYNATNATVKYLSTTPGCTPTATPIPPTATRVATATPAASPTPCAGFSDVPPGSTFYPYVTCLVNRGIIGGYADCTFRPNVNVTRGQLSKIVSLAAGYTDPPGTQTFQDVPPGSTFYAYVQQLSSRGHIGGYRCGGAGEPCVQPANRPYFRPNNNATRGQISKIVSNAAGFNELPGAQKFTDVPPTNTFYNYVQRLSNRGAMGGYPCGGTGEPCDVANRPYFRPNNNATRGQVSKIVATAFFTNCQSPAASR